MEDNRKYMEMALAIAFQRMGLTSPNPPVGSVIVKNNSVVATGGTGPYGTGHAEVAALSSAGDGCAGADMYVSLEPCSHYGKTPPCTDAIKRAGIARVFIPALDPNPLVSGKGVAELRKAGIDVVFMEDMADYAIDLIRPFKKFILRHRPFFIGKSAVTLDGRTATKTGDSRWISSEYSRYLTHKLRAKVDAIVIGKNTFLQDNPSLTVRLGSFDPGVADYFRKERPVLGGRDNYLIKSLMTADIAGPHTPLRIIIGLPDEIDMASNCLADDNYLFFERRDAVDRLLAARGSLRKDLGRINLHALDASSPAEEMHMIADELARRGKMFVLIEGGSRIAGSFLDAGETDQFLYIIAPKITGGGVASIDGAGAGTIGESLVLRDISVVQVKDDIIYSGYREPYNFETM